MSEFTSMLDTFHQIVFPESQSILDLTGQVTKAEDWYFNSGGNADIWRGHWVCKGTGNVTQVAVKVLKDVDSRVDLNRLVRESSIWWAVDHPNIAPFFGISFDFYRPTTPCLISLYYQHGDITSYVKRVRNVDRLALLSQAAAALSYLHSRGIVHGDIKGRNILINDIFEACLTDFGLSRVLSTSGFTTRTQLGTYRYMDPKLLPICDKGIEESAPRVTLATDVWAFAMTIIEVLSGLPPFWYIKTDLQVILSVIGGDRPRRVCYPQISDEIWLMLETCWHSEPNLRPSMASLTHFLTQQATLVSVRRLEGTLPRTV